jgi:hypothetical protein
MPDATTQRGVGGLETSVMWTAAALLPLCLRRPCCGVRAGPAIEACQERQQSTWSNSGPYRRFNAESAGAGCARSCRHPIPRRRAVWAGRASSRPVSRPEQEQEPEWERAPGPESSPRAARRAQAVLPGRAEEARGCRRARCDRRNQPARKAGLPREDRPPTFQEPGAAGPTESRSCRREPGKEPGRRPHPRCRDPGWRRDNRCPRDSDRPFGG